MPKTSEVKLKTPNVSRDPAIWRYSKAVFSDMSRGAETMLVEGVESKVYAGALTGLLSKHGISMPYYGPISKFLRDAGSIELLRRGNTYSESLWRVNEKPTRKQYDAWSDKGGVKNAAQRRKSSELLALIEQIKAFGKRLGTIDIPKAFAEQQKQIDRLTKGLAEANEKIRALEERLPEV
jgi:hypothetical protein